MYKIMAFVLRNILQLLRKSKKYAGVQFKKEDSTVVKKKVFSFTMKEVRTGDCKCHFLFKINLINLIERGVV
jgi:hypothetical protein